MAAGTTLYPVAAPDFLTHFLSTGSRTHANRWNDPRTVFDTQYIRQRLVPLPSSKPLSQRHDRQRGRRQTRKSSLCQHRYSHCARKVLLNGRLQSYPENPSLCLWTFQKRRPSSAVFSLRGDSFPAVVSLLLPLAGDIELNPGPNCYVCSKPICRGKDTQQFHINSCTSCSHKQFCCTAFNWHTHE